MKNFNNIKTSASGPDSYLTLMGVPIPVWCGFQFLLLDFILNYLSRVSKASSTDI